MNKTRREFLIRCARWGGVAALGAVTARLVWTGRDGRCSTASPCGGCEWFGRCALPKALATTAQDNRPVK